MLMYCLVSKFHVSADSADFEAYFGRNGDWFKFYETCEDFLGSELLKGKDGTTYLVIDKWMSKESYQNFIDENSLHYDQLTNKAEAMCDKNEVIGAYDLLQ